MPSSAAAPIPLLGSIAPLAAGSEAWLVDIWGVLHNGVSPFAGASRACRRFRAGGGTVVLVSNAPRPCASVIAQMDRIGVPRDAYDAVVSSGDTARSLIGALPRTGIFHLGPERDLPLFEGLDVRLVPAPEAAATVCTGLFDDETEAPEAYLPLLGDLAYRGQPMICANPDLTVARGGRIVPCAGALARLYEGLGGEVAYAGKPYPAIYELALAAVERHAGRRIARNRMLAIGDGVQTDIAGAAAAGIPSVFVASAVHVPEGENLDGAFLAGLFKGTENRGAAKAAAPPVAAMTALVW